MFLASSKDDLGSGKKNWSSSKMHCCQQWILPSCTLLLCFTAVLLFQSENACRSSSIGSLLRNDGTQQKARDADADAEGVCAGRRVYMYQLPPDFNENLARRCQRGESACNETWRCAYCGGLENFGMGLPVPEKNDTPPEMIKLQPPDAWYRTHQFSLEVIFHEKMKAYACLTTNPAIADAFYIPYYAGQDNAFSLECPQIQIRDRLIQRLVGWLSSQEAWQRTYGNRHFMVLGRQAGEMTRPESSNGKGMAITTQPELANVTVMWWEKAFSGIREMGIPYPTSFHPSSDEDLKLWQETIKNTKREWLIIFLGSASRGFSREGIQAFRQELLKQCDRDRGKCRNKDCTLRGPGMHCEYEPEVVTIEFSNSVFCLQPEGDSPTRKSVFDSMIAGCIPVLFSNQTAHYQYVEYLPRDWRKYSVVIPQIDIMEGRANIVDELSKIPEERVREMQATLREEILPRIVYSKPGVSTLFTDAMNFALQRFFHLNNHPGEVH